MEMKNKRIKEELQDEAQVLAGSKEVNIDKSETILYARAEASGRSNADQYQVSAASLATLQNIKTEQNVDLHDHIRIKEEPLPWCTPNYEDELLEPRNYIEIKIEPLPVDPRRYETHSSHTGDDDSTAAKDQSTPSQKKLKSKLQKTEEKNKTEQKIAADTQTKPQINVKDSFLQINKTKCNPNSDYSKSTEKSIDTTTETKSAIEIKDSAATVLNIEISAATHVQSDTLLNQTEGFDKNEVSLKYIYCDDSKHKTLSKNCVEKHLLNHDGSLPTDTCIFDNIKNNLPVSNEKKDNSKILSENIYLYDTCPYKHTSNTILEYHLQNNKELKSSIDVCTINDLKTYNEEIKPYSGEKPHSCNICAKKFTQKSHLKGHLLIHSGEKSNSCNICAKKFTQKSDLKKHLLIHSGEKPHSCNICSKKFIRKTHLNRHLLIHSGEKPHSCNVCGKKFARKSDLNKHLLTHTGEKPYSCNKCAKKFTRNSHLNNHLLTHSGDKPHSCNVCEKKYARKCDLNQHLLTHTRDKSHSFNLRRKKITPEIT